MYDVFIKYYSIEWWTLKKIQREFENFFCLVLWRWYVKKTRKNKTMRVVSWSIVFAYIRMNLPSHCSDIGADGTFFFYPVLEKSMKENRKRKNEKVYGASYQQEKTTKECKNSHHTEKKPSRKERIMKHMARWRGKTKKEETEKRRKKGSEGGMYQTRWRRVSNGAPPSSIFLFPPTANYFFSLLVIFSSTFSNYFVNRFRRLSFSMRKKIDYEQRK